MQKSLIKNPFIVFLVLFINLQLCFVVCYTNPHPLKWVFFVSVVAITAVVVLTMKRLNSPGMLHLGKRRSFILNIVNGVLIISGTGIIGLATDGFTVFEGPYELMSNAVMVFIYIPLLITCLVVPEIVIFQDGLMARGSMIHWNKIETVSVSVEGNVRLKLRRSGIPTLLFTDPETCDILMTELEKHGYGECDRYVRVRPEPTVWP